MRFADVIGQEEVKGRLLQMVREDRLPHALMLCGPQGSGKMALALALASYVLCGDEEKGDDSCGHCQHCRLTAKLQHPDLHYTFPTIKLPSMSAEHKPVSDDFIREWQDMLAEGPYFSASQWLTRMGAANQQAIITAGESDNLSKKLSLKSCISEYKVAVVWLPERMNTECANKILKLVEEPPSKTVFIMVSEQPELLPETIRSRVQRIEVRKTDDDAIRETLIGREGLDVDSAHRIARLAGGNWLKALDELSQESENIEFLDAFKRIMRSAFSRDVRGMKQWSDELSGLGREKQRRLLEYMLRMTRESFMYNFHEESLNYMSAREEEFVSRFSPFVNEANVVAFNTLYDDALRDIRQNANPKILFFDMALQITVLIRQK